MVQFNELKFVTHCSLLIDAELLNVSYYENVYIDSIIIDTEDTVCENGPSNNPPFKFKLAERAKDINLTLNVNSLVKDGPKMLFVYIECSGVPAISTPCGLDNIYTMQAVVDYQYTYDKALKLAQCTSKCGCSDGACEIDTVFANFALQYFRMKENLSAGNWTEAYDAYKYLMKINSPNNIKTKSNCSCNG